MKKYLLLIIGLILFVKCDFNYLDISKSYSIGDRGPGGGWIFYINPNWKSDSWKYMEAAPDSLAGLYSPLPAPVIWSNITDVYIGTTGTAIGTGATNTAAILAQSGHTNSAAKLCRDYRGGGYSDWFLPSLDELRTLAEAYKKLSVNRLVWDYWTSSEISATTSWVIYFKLDGSGDYDAPYERIKFNQENSGASVHPVRAF